MLRRATMADIPALCEAIEFTVSSSSGGMSGGSQMGEPPTKPEGNGG